MPVQKKTWNRVLVALMLTIRNRGGGSPRTILYVMVKPILTPANYTGVCSLILLYFFYFFHGA